MWPMKRSKTPTAAAAAAVNVVVSTPAPTSSSSSSSDKIDVRKEGITSIIAVGEEVQGNLRFRNGLKLDGVVHGSIQFGIDDGLLVINQPAVVHGDIHGPRAIVLGTVYGNIAVTGRLILLKTARVIGNIAAGSVQVNEGAYVSGRMCPIQELENTFDQPTTAPATITRAEPPAPARQAAQAPQATTQHRPASTPATAQGEQCSFVEDEPQKAGAQQPAHVPVFSAPQDYRSAPVSYGPPQDGNTGGSNMGFQFFGRNQPAQHAH